jgi:hypothetical protein
MTQSGYIFYLLCIAEICAVIIGFFYILVAAIFQVLVLLALFRKLALSKESFRPVTFVIVFVTMTMVFTGVTLSFRHTLLPLLLLALTAAVAIIYLVFLENRIVGPLRGSA